MKKLILTIALVAITAISCSKDDDGVYSELSNSSWQYEKVTKSLFLGFNKVETETYILMMSYNDVMTFNYFYKNNISSDSDISIHTKGTFTYKHPILKFTTEGGDVINYNVGAAKISITDPEGKVFIKN